MWVGPPLWSFTVFTSHENDGIFETLGSVEYLITDGELPRRRAMHGNRVIPTNPFARCAQGVKKRG